MSARRNLAHSEFTRITVDLTREQHRRLKWHAIQHNRTMAALVREWIDEQIDPAPLTLSPVRGPELGPPTGDAKSSASGRAKVRRPRPDGTVPNPSDGPAG